MYRHMVSVLVAVMLLASRQVFAVESATAPAAEVPAEYQQAARQIEQLVNAHDADAMRGMINKRTFMLMVMNGLPLSQEMRDEVLAGSGEVDITSGIVSEVAMGGSFRLQKMYGHGNDFHAIYRSVTVQDQMNYYDFYLVKDAKGVVRCIDIYSHLSGEWLSQIPRRAAVALAMKNDAGFKDRLTGVDRDLYDHNGEMQDLQQAIRAKDFDGVRRIIDGLPESIKGRRATQVMLLQTVWMWDAPVDARRAIIEKFHADFPKDPVCHVVSWIYYAYGRQFEEAHKAIGDLEALLGDDPYLTAKHGRIDFGQHTPEAGAKAEKELRAAIAGMPGFLPARTWLVGALSDQGKFADAVKEVAAAEELVHRRITMFDTDGHYRALQDSAEFKAFRANSK